jgi:DnaK suppressor protein
MTKAELETYRQALTALQTRLQGALSQLTDEALHSTGGEGSGGISNAPLHPADLGTDNFEQEFTLGLMENQEQALTEIADALERIRQGSFGKCEECGSAIPKGRLDALPYARHCVACARKLQQPS